MRMHPSSTLQRETAAYAEDEVRRPLATLDILDSRLDIVGMSQIPETGLRSPLGRKLNENLILRVRIGQIAETGLR